MLKQLRRSLPLEDCGLMAGIDNYVERIYPIANKLASPYAYEMEPLELLEAIMDLEDDGLDLLAIYHSHPNGPEVPSAIDIAQAHYPESAYIIVSFHDRTHPSVRAFHIKSGNIEEVLYSVV
jgi:proteasome lid subunit RPN8/RPN11